MGKYSVVPGPGGKLSAGKVVGCLDDHAPNLRRELRGKPRWQPAPRFGRPRAGQYPPHYRNQPLIRARFAWTLAALAVALVGCQTGVPGGRTASDKVPHLDAGVAAAAGLRPQDVSDAN